MSNYKFETLQLHVGQETPDPAADARPDRRAGSDRKARKRAEQSGSARAGRDPVRLRRR